MYHQYYDNGSGYLEGPCPHPATGEVLGIFASPAELAGSRWTAGDGYYYLFPVNQNPNRDKAVGLRVNAETLEATPCVS